MGKLRTRLSDHPAEGLAAAAAVLVLACAAFAYQSFGGGGRYPPGVSTQAYFTTDENAAGAAAVGALFVDDVNKIPPFDHAGKQAYRAIVYTDGKVRWVHLLVRYRPGAKLHLESEAAEAVKQGRHTGPDFGSVSDGDREIKRPGPGPWLTAKDAEYGPADRVQLPPNARADAVDVAVP